MEEASFSVTLEIFLKVMGWTFLVHFSCDKQGNLSQMWNCLLWKGLIFAYLCFSFWLLRMCGAPMQAYLWPTFVIPSHAPVLDMTQAIS